MMQGVILVQQAQGMTGDVMKKGGGGVYRGLEGKEGYLTMGRAILMQEQRVCLQMGDPNHCCNVACRLVGERTAGRPI